MHNRWWSNRLAADREVGWAHPDVRLIRRRSTMAKDDREVDVEPTI